MRKLFILAFGLLVLSPMAQARVIHRHHVRAAFAAREVTQAPAPRRYHHYRVRDAEPPAAPGVKPAEYKLAKVKAVPPLLFDHALLFDPAPRLSVNRFSKAAAWAGALSY